jgi:rare lipoprotein A (peptidoglycan hydrolase)
VAVADSVAGSTVPPRANDNDTSVAPGQIGDFQEQNRSFEPRANPRQPARAESLLKPTPRPTPPPNPTHTVSGSASWYCKAGVSSCHDGYPGGLYAAAGPALRVGDWRGRTVSVCGSGSCVNVKLIDSCWCASGRVIDLYSDAFSQLAPTSAGTISVRVSW